MLGINTRKHTLDGHKRLTEIYQHLPPHVQETLLEFAEFLASKHPASGLENQITEPLDIPRPENESVVTAIKRLATTYPMLDRSKMLSDTSSLMGQHVMQGVSAPEIIDQLEALFQQHYREFLEDQQ